jgi:hypothetical protein
MSFTQTEKTAIIHLKSSIASYYNLQMKKVGDRMLESYFYNSCVITGGMIQSLYHNEAVSDIDLYAKTVNDIALIRLYLTSSKSDIIKNTRLYDLDDGQHAQEPQKLITVNAITLTNDVQFVHLDIAEVCRQKFDFVHCMPYYDLMTQKLHISVVQFRSIVNKQLIPNTKGEEIKEYRIKKYIDKGWKSWERKQTTSIALDTNTLMISAIA